MEGFDPRTSFGYEESKRYDAVDTRGDEEQTVAFLAQLAGQRDALEFAVGTGRIALPLVKAGGAVDDIELSQDMVDRMREKPDGNNVKVTMGDMSRVTTGRSYGLVCVQGRQRVGCLAPDLGALQLQQGPGQRPEGGVVVDDQHGPCHRLIVARAQRTRYRGYPWFGSPSRLHLSGPSAAASGWTSQGWLGREVALRVCGERLG